MKFLFVTSVATALTYAGDVWPTASRWAQTPDARPEAILTGAVLLMLASLLRRNAVGWRPK